MTQKLTLRNLSEIKKHRNNSEGVPTVSSAEQSGTEALVAKKFEEFCLKYKFNKDLPLLLRDQHINYLKESLWYLPTPYQTLDASRAWLCYWILHAVSLLGTKLDSEIESDIVDFLRRCQSPTGGFGGGPGQIAHLAPTYSAVHALVIIGTEEAYNVINREKLKEFLLSVHQPDGSFAMHVDGEVDIRGVYCALAVASITDILDKELTENTAEWIVSCQTYEGGFAGCPGMEAHGGYAFCGLSALVILQKGHLIDQQAFLRWIVNRQMKFEGGFQGRTNKLVDGCYSFWQGGAFPLLYGLLGQEGYPTKDHLFDERALQEYLLICCQHPNGGLLDKPGKPRDVFHTCYTLSGLSVAQHFDNEKKILGPLKNKVLRTHTIYNVRPDLVRKAFLHFTALNHSVENGTQML